MGKELIKIDEVYIQEHSENFNCYLNELFPTLVWDLVNKLLPKTNVYLFSGIIRDYFLEAEHSFRDIDFVIEDDLEIESLFSDLPIRKNTFGGYKIMIDSITIDLWSIKNTWGIKINPFLPFAEFSDILELPRTTFFNSSSILFSLNDKEFIVGKPFLDFLEKKELDIVLEKNPEPALCVINSLYYKEKYQLKLSKKLKKYILKNRDKYVSEFDNIQEKHFKEIIYTTEDIVAKLHFVSPSQV